MAGRGETEAERRWGEGIDVMNRKSDSLPIRQHKAAKIKAILRDYIGEEMGRLSCLDIGCREGVIAQALAMCFGFVVGMDIDPIPFPGLSFDKIPTPSWTQGDGAQLPFPNHHFDVIIFAQVYEHVEHPYEVVREIVRVLKPGGLVFFSGPNRWALIEEHYHLPLLSWLPQKLADWYMRAAQGGNAYEIRPQSYWQLKDLWRGFEIRDYTPKLLRNPRDFHVAERVPFKFPRRLANALKPFVPNFNWILVKWTAKNCIPSDAYTQEYYLTACDGYAEYNTSRGESLPRRLSRPLEIAQVEPGQMVLDIGCGRGEFALNCANEGAMVWGLDYASAALQLAANLPITPTLGFQQADAGALPFGEDSLDTIFMLDIVEHLTPLELQNTLREVQRTLKPQGRLIIHTMPNLWYYRFGYPLYRWVGKLRGQDLPRDPRSRWDFAQLHVNEQDPLKLGRALRSSGFHPHIWLESTQEYKHESNRRVRWIMQKLTRFPFLKWIFCNDIFAIATKNVSLKNAGNLKR